MTGPRLVGNATGRKIAVKKNPRSLRDVMRRHLREEGKRIKDLAPVWGMVEVSCYRRFYDNRPFAPQLVEAFIELLQLDEFDANELRVLGAIEAGWNLNLKLQVV